MKTKEEIALNVVLSIDHQISAEQIILTPDHKKEGNCLNQLCKLIELALEEYASQSKWISVNTPPKEKGFYLVNILQSYSSGRRGTVEIGECFETVAMVGGEMKAVLRFQDYVTHYQPLQSPPSLTD